MVSVSAGFCDVDFATILFHDAVTLSDRAGRVFWRQNQAERNRGFFDARLEKRLLHGLFFEVFNELLEAI